ncbi:hypothetical protein [Sphingomonas sp. Leaf257]|jgi:hypothetical protein|uniref:hypothetical protein n=1 Tax=Sphingomonas sp. Leaf257 TaxID=1736309 RepID=UPI001F4907CB|nr:hypothetical protein [Sphingomonas sp. Leaf257]
MMILHVDQPDYAVMAEAAPLSEWSIPRLVADIWTEGDEEDRREIDRHLARLRRQGEADHAAMMSRWTFG